ncbi:hypothetical protein EB796_004777 [Bugula neritina]|uniref:RRM domain-containing protein n=1 Tax=Bugula neritina TaxID=10212 RepID=A0A7J7KE33_BUGNE|nr:hypothetical protein EB796_004777 [Bugula neritina]
MTGTKRKVYKGLLSPPGVKAEQAVDPELSQTALYLPSLPDSVTDRELFDFFKQFGPLVDVVLPWDSYTGRKRGFGRVQFAKMEDAKRALDSKHSSGSFSEIKQSEKRYESKLEKEKLYIRVESPETQSLVQTICGPDSLRSLRAASAYFPLLFVPMTSPESALKALERLQAEGVYVLFARERQAGLRGQRRF